MKKYCIGFLPMNNSKEIISITNKISNIEKIYQLGDKSIPHVTLCQFFAEEDEVKLIWNAVTECIENNIISLSFATFSCITFDEKMFWISLLPSETEDLHRLRNEICSIIKISNTKSYDPHLTLLSTEDKNYKVKAEPIIKEYRSISDDFILSLGACDNLGQFIKIIHQEQPRTSFAYGY